MDLPVGRQSKAFWRGHVEAYSRSSCSMAEYCRQNGLVLSRFAYHRNTLSKKSKFSEVKPVSQTSSGARAVENASYPQRLPDPKWLSALIRELSR